MLHSVVNQFCHKVSWGELDYLVVDMPPGTGDVQLSLAQLVPVTGAVLVTTPQEVSMQDVRKAYHMFEKVRVPVLGFVENMSLVPLRRLRQGALPVRGGGRRDPGEEIRRPRARPPSDRDPGARRRRRGSADRRERPGIRSSQGFPRIGPERRAADRDRREPRRDARRPRAFRSADSN